MIAKIIAPWTPEQVDSLNAYQTSGAFHPYTCVTHSDEPLVATPAGWTCPCCSYRQDWALASMTDNTWRDRVFIVDDSNTVR